jgi:hypothetical protein
MKILVCLIKQACLLAIISKIFWGVGVDDSILWLSFAQQKLLSASFKAYLHGQLFSVSDATAASDTSQKIGRILFFVQCRMWLSHLTLQIMVRVNRLLHSVV